MKEKRTGSENGSEHHKATTPPKKHENAYLMKHLFREVGLLSGVWLDEPVDIG